MSTTAGTPDPSGQYPVSGHPQGRQPNPSSPPGPGAPQRPGPPPGPGGPYEPPNQEPQRPFGFDDRGKVRRGKISATYVSLILATVVLILLIIFIAQNLDNSTIHYLGASGKLPLGLLMLIAAIAGVIITAIPATVRMLQLRKALKRNTPPDQRTPDHTRGTP